MLALGFVIASVYILLFYCILGIGLVSLCIVLTIIKKGENVSAPVHPHVLIIVKTHENRVEHILAKITNDLTAKNYFNTLKNCF